MFNALNLVYGRNVQTFEGVSVGGNFDNRVSGVDNVQDFKYVSVSGDFRNDVKGCEFFLPKFFALDLFTDV